MVHALVKIIGDFYYEEILNPFIIILVNIVPYVSLNCKEFCSREW